MIVRVTLAGRPRGLGSRDEGAAAASAAIGAVCISGSALSSPSSLGIGNIDKHGTNPRGRKQGELHSPITFVPSGCWGNAGCDSVALLNSTANADMIEHSQEKEREVVRPAFADDSQGDVVSLKPLVRFLAMYRRVLGLAVVAALGLCIVVLLVLMLILPAERTASLQVRLLFDGAAEGRYPNGTPFSPAEIVATPILSEVYRINDLQRFGRYEDFKESMTVLQASLEHELLAAAYTARLADTKLSSTDRARLEDEFRKRRAAIKDPLYTLAMRRSSRLKVMPATLGEKVLNDTLAVWSEQAKALKGALRFNVPVVSRDILNPKALERDFLIAADDLRLQARRAVDIAEGLLLIPGAESLRSQKEGVSLSDVTFALSDTLRTEIEPLVNLIQQSGLANDPVAMQRYVRGRVTELRLERDATRARIQTMQDALQGYMSTKGARTRDASAGTGPSGRQQGGESQTLIPQLSDTFWTGSLRCRPRRRRRTSPTGRTSLNG